MAGLRLLSEHIGILGPQFVYGHPPKRGDLFLNVKVHTSLLLLGSREPLTTVDTEHGFFRNLKAGWTRIREIRGLSRFSSDENGTVPLVVRRAGIIAGQCRPGIES